MNDIRKVSLLLPNLRYTKNDKKIYFKTIRCVQLINNNKKILENTFNIGDIALSGRFKLFDINVKCNIQEIEHDNGLIVDIEYNNINKFVYDKQLLKIAKYIEGILCNLDVNNIDDFMRESDFYDKIYGHDSDSDNSKNYLNNNNINNGDINNDLYEQQQEFDNYEEDYYDDEDYDDPEY